VSKINEPQTKIDFVENLLEISCIYWIHTWSFRDKIVQSLPIIHFLRNFFLWGFKEAKKGGQGLDGITLLETKGLCMIPSVAWYTR